MSIGTQDAKANGIEWVRAELAKEDPKREPSVLQVLNIALEELEAEERRNGQAQRIADIDEMDLPFDFDTEFGTEGVNVTVRQMIKEERANNFIAFNAEYDRLKAEYDEGMNGALERELQLQRQNEELQEKFTTLEESSKRVVSDLIATKDERDRLADLLRERDLRMGEVERNRKNAADQLEEARTEIERLERIIDEQRIQNAFGERGLQRTIDVTETAQRLFEQAKQATAEKRKMMITAEIGANFREVQGADGNKEVVHISALQDMDIVDSLTEIEAPELEVVAEEVFQGEVESLPEVQPSADGSDYESEQSAVGETEPQTEYVTKAEFQELESFVHRINDLIYDRLGEHAA